MLMDGGEHGEASGGGGELELPPLLPLPLDLNGALDGGSGAQSARTPQSPRLPALSGAQTARTPSPSEVGGAFLTQVE